MYYLTLSEKDRMAIDWIGPRYSHGDDLRRVLENKCDAGQLLYGSLIKWGEDYNVNFDCPAWDSDEDLTFAVPEKSAWQIKDLIEEDGMACFSPKLVQKFNEFVSKIV